MSPARSRTAALARAGASLLAGSSMAIWGIHGMYPPPPLLRPDLLPDQALNLAPVGAALGLAHHPADNRADGLVVAGADLLDRVSVVGQGLFDDVAQLVAAGLRQTALPDDRRGVTALLDERAENLLRRVAGHLTRSDHRDQSRQRARLDLGVLRLGVAE